jgi:hypothetical protein
MDGGGVLSLDEERVLSLARLEHDVALAFEYLPLDQANGFVMLHEQDRLRAARRRVRRSGGGGRVWEVGPKPRLRRAAG